MKYLDKIVRRLTQRIEKKLEKECVTKVEATHVAALLIQVLTDDLSYAEIALKAIRREQGRFTKLENKDS